MCDGPQYEADLCGSPAIDARLREDAKKAMVFSAEDLLGWSDFPKGLRVLLLHQDGPSAKEIKSKLEEMDYIVSLFCDENEALEAISLNAESFHVAIVEVTTGNNHGHFRFLEMARVLPTIMISNAHCLSTMMKCIALGAAEFLDKPISEEKLRNIWQHVVHKAFNAGGSALSKSLKPIKETVVSMLGLNSDSGNTGFQNQNSSEVQHAGKYYESELEDSVPNDRFPAPSTPQLEQGGRLMDDGDCQEQPNFSIVESKEHAQESVEPREFSSKLRTNDKTCKNLNEKVKDESASTPTRHAAEEVDSADGSKTKESRASDESFLSSSHLDNGEHIDSSAKEKKASMHHSPHTYVNRTKKKKMKVDWTPELHRQFVQAVEQLGIDQAIPSKILELMKVEGLTRHNVASHLQKYRMQRRYILPRDEERRWQQHRDPRLRGYIHKPHVAFPPIHSNFTVLPSQAYPVWGHPSYHPSSIPIWGHTGFPTWQPSPDIWPWKTYPKMHADAWGLPVVPTQSQFSNLPQNLPQSHDLNSVDYEYGESRHSHNFHPAEEIVDKMVKEAISKPWLPLPLGLKPPSMETVLAELHSQGISNIPSLNPTSSSPPLHFHR